MGQAADDQWEAENDAETDRFWIARGLRKAGCKCPDRTPWEIDDDGLYCCTGCGATTDL